MDMEHRLGASSEMMGYVASGLAISVVISSLTLLGPVFAAIGRGRGIILGLVLMTTCLIAIPLISNYLVYYALNMINMSGVVLIDSGSNIECLKLFPGPSSSIPIQILDLFNMLGGFIASLMSAQLSDQVPIPQPNSSFSSDNQPPGAAPSNRLLYLFNTGGILALISAACIATILCVRRKNRLNDSEVSINNKSLESAQEESDANFTTNEEPSSLVLPWKCWIVFWSVAMIGAEYGAEMTSFNFLSTFLHKQGFPKTVAITINTWGLGFNLIGRVSALFSLTKLSPKYIILILTGLYTLSPLAMIFTVLHPSCPLLTIACGALMHLGFSANFAAQFSYINSRVPISNAIGSLIYATIGLVNICDPLIIGSLIDQWPRICLVVIIAQGTINLLGFVIIETSFKLFARHPQVYVPVPQTTSDGNR